MLDDDVANIGRTFQQNFQSHGDLRCVTEVIAKFSFDYLNPEMDKSQCPFTF